MMTCHHQPLVFEFKKFATGLKCMLFFLQYLNDRHISDNFNSLSRIFFKHRRRRLAGGLNSAALRSGFELYFQRFDSRIFFKHRRRRLAGGLNSAALRSGFELYFQRFDSPGWNYYIECNFWQKPMKRGLNAFVGRIKKAK
jgi:hypothetical protein